MKLLAVDTGTKQSAYVIVDSKTYEPIYMAKVPNDDLMQTVRHTYYEDAVVEMFSSYGGGSGREVFESIVMVGRILEATWQRNWEATRITRLEVKKHICQSVNANDAAIIRALKDRFGDKGTKDNKGFFWGMKADCWQAYALAVTHLDRLHEKIGREDDADEI
jgi:hypothetical protein